MVNHHLPLFYIVLRIIMMFVAINVKFNAISVGVKRTYIRLVNVLNARMRWKINDTDIDLHDDELSENGFYVSIEDFND